MPLWVAVPTEGGDRYGAWHTGAAQPGGHFCPAGRVTPASSTARLTALPLSVRAASSHGHTRCLIRAGTVRIPCPGLVLRAGRRAPRSAGGEKGSRRRARGPRGSGRPQSGQFSGVLLGRVCDEAHRVSAREQIYTRSRLAVASRGRWEGPFRLHSGGGEGEGSAPAASCFVCFPSSQQSPPTGLLRRLCAPRSLEEGLLLHRAAWS